MAAAAEIPNIDISAFLDPSSTSSAKSQVVEQVRSACSQYGFLQIIGHGIPLESQRQMLNCCKTLFDLPLRAKEAVSLKNSPSRHGYEGMREQVLDKTALPDDKEGFYVGREEAEEKGFRQVKASILAPIIPQRLTSPQGPNQWPDLPIEIFRAPVEAYYASMVHLATKLLEMIALGLGVPIVKLESFTRKPACNLKLLHYPPHLSKDSRQAGAGMHTDFGCLTILLQQPGKHGLEVYHNEEWLKIPAVEDVFVINVGDLLGKWSGGVYKSTLHRVINSSDSDRYSVPCFYEGDYSATNPFDSSQTAGEETVEEHIRRKFDLSYGL
jgi:isopenicillin N synthase-like dioxygenase